MSEEVAGPTVPPLPEFDHRDGPSRILVTVRTGEKYGPGADIVIGGASYEEFEVNIRKLFGHQTWEQMLMRWDVEVAKRLGPNVSDDQAKKNLADGGVIPQQQPQPQAQQQPGRNCPHGQMTYREGKSAKGPWAGYFCPLPRGDQNQCKPQFVN